MKKALATLCTIVALCAPTSVEASAGAGNCIERIPIRITVQKGDTLTRLARSYCGDSSQYAEIARYNKVEDPNRLLVGQVVEIPCNTYEQTRFVSVSDASFGSYCSIHDAPPYSLDNTFF